MAKRAPSTAPTTVPTRTERSPIANLAMSDNPTRGTGGSGPIEARSLLYSSEGNTVKVPTTLSEVKMEGINDEERKRLVTEIRREYQRQYYQKHKEKAKEYQRQYNLTHKKKARGGRGKASFNCPREKVRTTFNTADLMHSPVEKTVKMLEKIINGERLFTM